MAETYDVIIIGGGPGGYVAAIRAVDVVFGAELAAAFKSFIENPMAMLV